MASCTRHVATSSGGWANCLGSVPRVHIATAWNRSTYRCAKPWSVMFVMTTKPAAWRTRLWRNCCSSDSNGTIRRRTMSLHESTWDGAYLSPLSVCALPVLVAIVALRVLIREMPLRR